MNPFTFIGVAGAALVAGLLIFIKGGMAPKHHRSPVGGGSASGAGIPDASGDSGVFDVRIQKEGGMPGPTQTETQTLSNGQFDDSAQQSEPSVSYASAGDGLSYSQGDYGSKQPAGQFPAGVTPQDVRTGNIPAFQSAPTHEVAAPGSVPVPSRVAPAPSAATGSRGIFQS